MAISDNSTRVVVTLGAGATSTTFPFDYLSSSYIAVTFDKVLKTAGSDYTITDKTVTFTTALTATTSVGIFSIEPYGTILDLVNPEEWDADKINTNINTIVILLQQLRDQAVLVDIYDPITNAVELIEDAVEDSANSATESADSATASADSATASAASAILSQEWAETASATAIPDGSITTDKIADNAITTAKIADSSITTDKIADNAITAVKMSESDTFTFNDIISNSNFTTDNGAFLGDSNGWEFTTETGINIRKTITDVGISLYDDGDNVTGIGFQNYNNTATSNIQISDVPGGRLKMATSQGVNSNLVVQSDFTAGSSGTTYFVKLPNGLIIQFGIFVGSNLVFPTQFTQVSTVGVVVTPQTGNSIAQIAAQVTTTSCYVEHGQTTNNFIAIGY